ncbi:MAG: ECF-type sigma factor [Aquimonas sp.]|nr:ECF-type sigma factor [Aquimonas sp.]
MVLPQDITRLLQAAGEGDRAALDRLVPLVYESLRKIARSQRAGEQRAHTLSTTALVNEAWLRLLGPERSDWQCEAHFYRYAAKAMRHILIDAARSRQAQKRGGGAEHVELDSAPPIAEQACGELLALDQALLQLAEVNPRLAQVVELRFFAGLEVEQVAEVLGINARSVVRDWAKARALLAQMLESDPLGA